MSTGDDGSSFKINVINLTEREVMEKKLFSFHGERENCGENNNNGVFSECNRNSVNSANSALTLWLNG